MAPKFYKYNFKASTPNILIRHALSTDRLSNDDGSSHAHFTDGLRINALIARIVQNI